MQRAADLDAVTKERDGAKKLSDDLRNQRLKEFMEGFGIISMKLKEMYQVRCVPSSPLDPANVAMRADDHARRERRARTRGLAGSVLGRHHLQRHAAEEELEEHLEPLRR